MQRRKRRNRKRRNRNQGWDKSTSRSNTQQRIPNQVGLILPDRYRTKLRYLTNVSFNLAAVNNAAFRWRPTSAFDVDPLVGGTSMSGFTELAAIYSTYRVLSSSFEAQLCNASAVNYVLFAVAPVNADPGATPSAGYIVTIPEQPYSKHAVQATQGAPSRILRNYQSTEKQYGSKAVLFDDNFSSLVTTSPVNNWFWVFSASIMTVAAVSVSAFVTILVDVEFYDRIYLQG